MSRRRRRGSLLPLLALAVPVAAIAGWAHLREPLGAWGLGAVLAPALALGALAPGIAVSLESLPLLLVPGRARIWWRHRQAGRRPSIASRLRRAVYAADRHRCCWCKSPLQLQLDHVKPWSRGGLTALWNLMTLCSRCNRVKSDYWVARDGYRFYRPWQGASDEREAARILAFELRHRWSPGRWIRAGWSLSL
jgi:HNH endonuclease